MKRRSGGMQPQLLAIGWIATLTLGCAIAPSPAAPSANLAVPQREFGRLPSDPSRETGQKAVDWRIDLNPIGVRIYLSGDDGSNDALEAAAYLGGFTFGPVVPTIWSQDQALGFHFGFQYSPQGSEEFDFRWDIFTFDAGIRYFPYYTSKFEIYFLAEAGYMWWAGRGSDDISGVLRVKPRDLYGFNFGVGGGANVFFNETIGVGVQAAYRYWDRFDNDPPEDIFVSWLELSSGVRFRF